MSKELVMTLSRKLGLSDPKVLRKCEEILRLIDIRNIPLSLNCTSKVAIALDLAASAVKVPFERSQAIVLSGESKRKYLVNFRVVEEMLELALPSSIREICVQLGCVNVIKLAEEILRSYQKLQSSSDCVEFDKPMFLISAIHVACKQTKTKVQQSKLIELARVKKSVFENIVSVMKTLAEKNKVINESPKRQLSLLENLDDTPENKIIKSNKKFRMDETDCDDTENSYEKWRERILSSAGAHA